MGLVLADSSIVVLALPEIYRSLDVSVNGVVWVLVAFNLVLALCAVPAAHAARRVGPARAAVAGLVLFGAASLACGVASSLGVLLAARCVQAVGGAAAVCAALELLPAEVGSERRAAAIWAAAGAAGAALGPAVGGLLTELISWESIFLVQVPLALGVAGVLAPVARREGSVGAVAAELRPTGRPHLAANLSLGLVSAALVAALFLVVLLLIEGWRLSPIAAAATVSVLPLSALVGARLASRFPSAPARAAAGAILIAGGLTALALLPEASVLATFPPQILAGLGLALALSALTEAALDGKAPQAIHGGWTISARHAGVVVSLLLLTPVFTADLREQRDAAGQAGTAALLDARLPPLLKIEIAGRLADGLGDERGRVPVIDPAFEPPPGDAEDRPAVENLRDELQDQLDRAATHAFSASFLISAAFAAAALLPIAMVRRRPEEAVL
ncbi:MAG: MFS transporter [Actinomycetota bacterium]